MCVEMKLYQQLRRISVPVIYLAYGRKHGLQHSCNAHCGC